jgi:hypothetical protein
VDGDTLQAGDARGYVDESIALQVAHAGEGRAEVLLFELPRE